MNESICEGFRYSLSILDMNDLRSTYIANCIFNNFLTYSAIMLNILTIYAVRKNVLATQNIENIATESCCFRHWCWFHCSTILHVIPCQVVTTERSKMQHIQGLRGNWSHIFSSFVLECCRCECRQVLSCSSASQIPGTCNS